MTIYSVLLSRGYFPKELPPAFSTEEFARYATTNAGRRLLRAYQPPGNYTECVEYYLALSGAHRRVLSIPHPFSYAALAALVAKNFKRLLARAGASKFARSRPVYVADGARAFRPLTSPANTFREKAATRAAARVLLKADVSQFYPSLYTHAVGWAVDPKLRLRANWRNNGLLGKQLDQALMDCQGKRSQGLPVGPDISTLLAEIVLSQVDRELGVAASAAFRWVDDYEFGCSSTQEAERLLAQLERSLKRFNLRLNHTKTRIVESPVAVHDEWQLALQVASKGLKGSATELVRFFDLAFGRRLANPDSPVLNYACGSLFGIPRPRDDHGANVAQSCLSQVLLAEPGAAQKVFALLSFWTLNGMKLDEELVTRTVREMIVSEQHRGLSSDVAWALAFCLRHSVPLDRKTGLSLSESQDDCSWTLALDLRARNLATSLKVGPLDRLLRNADLDGEHWLLAYESARRGVPSVRARVQGHALFGPMLAADVAFYRNALPAYAEVVHVGGAPEWIVKNWLKSKTFEPSQKVALMVSKDVEGEKQHPITGSELLANLISRLAATKGRDEGGAPY
ncbi:MAG: RNA-directed DNA polymerase [Myxococcaceae bacterium]